MSRQSLSDSATFPETGEAFITSWSGGKDACYAFWLAQRQGSHPAALYTMLDADGTHTGSHGLHREIIEAQANALGVPVLFRSVPRGHYEQHMKDVIGEAREKFGITSVVFGDIDLDAHKDWLDRVTDEANIIPRFPLWHYTRRQLLDDVLSAGFKTMIVSVKHDKMDMKYLGKIMTPELADEIEVLGICPTAEDGEFHSLVVDGPCFTSPLKVKTGAIRQDSWGHSMIQITLSE
ncbi:diphthine--ammonia ligase [Endozoicomonas ascidiicola]|uniref:Dph6-related ATP pyrophosphatase n=1 Tax=Endozoicomonas ascidiicola TaxID=1698521 RepID=UPI000831FD40|nr:diphthine--ammonia ligase [Endozoicomonas ascidiicola]